MNKNQVIQNKVKYLSLILAIEILARSFLRRLLLQGLVLTSAAHVKVIVEVNEISDTIVRVR